jgi:hypothetical protein
MPHGSTQQCSQLLLVTSRVPRVYGVHFTAHVRLSDAVDCLLLQLTSAAWSKDNGEGSELPVTVLFSALRLSHRGAVVGAPK